MGVDGRRKRGVNQHLSTTATIYNTTVIFWCSVGHAVYDGTTARSIKCEIDGAWSARLPSCDREYGVLEIRRGFVVF